MNNLERRIDGLERAAAPHGGVFLVVAGGPMPSAAEATGRTVVVISTGVPRAERGPTGQHNGN
jgi:hypothetical protein